MILSKRGAAAEGRRPSFGSGRRPRQYYCQKIVFLLAKKRYFDDFWRFLRLPRTISRGFSEGPPKSSMFLFFYDFWQFSGDLPNSIKILFVDNFQSIRGFTECAGAGPLQPKLLNSEEWLIDITFLIVHSLWLGIRGVDPFNLEISQERVLSPLADSSLNSSLNRSNEARLW